MMFASNMRMVIMIKITLEILGRSLLIFFIKYDFLLSLYFDASFCHKLHIGILKHPICYLGRSFSVCGPALLVS
jgi:hypothetical protein